MDIFFVSSAAHFNFCYQIVSNKIKQKPTTGFDLALKTQTHAAVTLTPTHTIACQLRGEEERAHLLVFFHT